MKKTTLIIATLVSVLSLKIDSSLATFKDVAPSHPNYDAINYVQSEGIVSGYSDGSYKPDQTISRYEFTKIIVGATHSKETISKCTTSPFKDVPKDWFTPYVCLAQKEGIINGYPDGTFKGKNSINLVEAAKIIVKGFKYSTPTDPIWYKPFIDKLAQLHAIPVSFIHLDDKVNRGQMAELTFRLLADVQDKKSTSYQNLKNGIQVPDYNAKEISQMAENYYNDLMEKDDSALGSYGVLITLSDDGNLDNDFISLEKTRVSTVNHVKNMTDAIAALPGFQGNVTMRDALVIDLKTLANMLENEEKQLIALWSKMAQIEGDIPLELINQENDLLDTIGNKRDEAYKILKPVLTAFKEKYGLLN